MKLHLIIKNLSGTIYTKTIDLSSLEPEDLNVTLWKLLELSCSTIDELIFNGQKFNVNHFVLKDLLDLYKVSPETLQSSEEMTITGSLVYSLRYNSNIAISKKESESIPTIQISKETINGIKYFFDKTESGTFLIYKVGDKTNCLLNVENTVADIELGNIALTCSNSYELLTYLNQSDYFKIKQWVVRPELSKKDHSLTLKVFRIQSAIKINTIDFTTIKTTEVDTTHPNFFHYSLQRFQLAQLERDKLTPPYIKALFASNAALLIEMDPASTEIFFNKCLIVPTSPNTYECFFLETDGGDLCPIENDKNKLKKLLQLNHYLDSQNSSEDEIIIIKPDLKHVVCSLKQSETAKKILYKEGNKVFVDNFRQHLHQIDFENSGSMQRMQNDLDTNLQFFFK